MGGHTSEIKAWLHKEQAGRQKSSSEVPCAALPFPSSENGASCSPFCTKPIGQEEKGTRGAGTSPGWGLTQRKQKTSRQVGREGFSQAQLKYSVGPKLAALLLNPPTHFHVGKVFFWCLMSIHHYHVLLPTPGETWVLKKKITYEVTRFAQLRFYFILEVSRWKQRVQCTFMYKFDFIFRFSILTCNLAYNERFMPQSNVFWGRRQKANLQLLVWRCTNSLKGVKMEKAFLIFTEVSSYHKVSSFQKRKKKTRIFWCGSLQPHSCKLLWAGQPSHHQEVYWLHRY